MSYKLSQLKIGQRAKLTSYGAISPYYRRYLLAFGLTEGIIVYVAERAPFGCPIALNVRGSLVALRLDEASDLEWDVLDE